jgi:hypothetical protein
MARVRWSLDGDAWPARDQAAWLQAQQTGRLFRRRGLAAHWAKDTLKRVAQAYGQCHFSLLETRSFDSEQSSMFLTALDWFSRAYHSRSEICLAPKRARTARFC